MNPLFFKNTNIDTVKRAFKKNGFIVSEEYIDLDDPSENYTALYIHYN